MSASQSHRRSTAESHRPCGRSRSPDLQVPRQGRHPTLCHGTGWPETERARGANRSARPATSASFATVDGPQSCSCHLVAGLIVGITLTLGLLAKAREEKSRKSVALAILRTERPAKSGTWRRRARSSASDRKRSALAGKEPSPAVRRKAIYHRVRRRRQSPGSTLGAAQCWNNSETFRARAQPASSI